MNKNTKSAKDIAFNKERQNFQKEIKKRDEMLTDLRRLIIDKDNTIYELERKIETLNETISFLTNGNHSPEELTEHMIRSKRINKVLSLVDTFSTGLY